MLSKNKIIGFLTAAVCIAFGNICYADEIYPTLINENFEGNISESL